MANSLYPKGLNKFARGDIKWLASAGSDFRAILITSSYTYSTAHEFFSDLGTGGTNYRGDHGTNTRAGALALTEADPDGTGACDATDDLTFRAIAAGTIKGVVIFVEVSTDANSPLVAYYDTDSGGKFPITANGGDITIQWQATTPFCFKI